MRTNTMKLADILLGEPVDVFIRIRRARGETLKSIRDELCERTGGKVDVSDQTLINWCQRTLTKESNGGEAA